MYIMMADEADQDGSKEFLVYAAVFFSSSRLLELHKRVETLRQRNGFKDGDVLKFSSGTRPEGVSSGKHAEIKNQILSEAAKFGCQACCYVIPHAIAKGQSHENKLKYGMNTLLMKFDQFLRESGNVPGIAFFDQTRDLKQKAYLKEVSEYGMLFKKERKKLKNIVALNDTEIGLSHLCSVTDIVVGSFRWVVKEPDKNVVGATLMKQLAKIMWGKTDAMGTKKVWERGLCIRPQEVNLHGYQADIQALISRIQQYAKQE